MAVPRRHHIVKWVGTHALPDGSMTECYAFVHVLYRQALYDRQLPGRRARLHGLIGERLAALYTQRMEEVAPELAYHFEQASDSPRAIDSIPLIEEQTTAHCSGSDESDIDYACR